jgi:2-keto-4-pentenoate hydratase/2-oxohepta-3-ene-1,7-dioic acid hydratase in catechol pathway
MRWVTYRTDQAADRVGLIVDDEVLGVASDRSLLGLLELGSERMRDIGEQASSHPTEVLPLASVALQLPFRPPTIRDAAGFLQHLRNNARVLGNELDPRFEQYPAFYFANVVTAIGTDTPVQIPPGGEQMDFELEIGAVIGKPGMDISVDEATAHIAGYLIFCDWASRDIQFSERGLFGPMKGKDFANSFGPALVTPDEIEEHRSERGYNLQMTAYVNGEQVTDGTWSDIDWDFPDMIAFASRGVPLVPGEVIGSGTVPTGCLLESYSHDPDRFRGWLRPGDEIVLRVEQLGELRHTFLPSRPAQRLTSGH